MANTLRVLLILLLIPTAIAWAQNAEPGDPRLRQDINEHYDIYFRALEKRDFNKMFTLLAPSYQFKTVDGKVLDHDAYTARIRIARRPGVSSALTREVHIVQARGTQVMAKVIERYTYADIDKDHARHIYVIAFPYQDTWDIVDNDWKKVYTEQQPVEYYKDGKAVIEVP